LTQEHSDWLPFDALTSPAVTSAFEPVVTAWSQRWFGARPFELARVRSQQGGRSLKSAKAEWRAFGHGIFIDCAEKTQLAVAGHALHMSSREHKLSSDDEGLMLLFSERITADLASGMAGIVGDEKGPRQTSTSGHPFEHSGGLELQISGGPDSTIMVGISSSALTRLRKSQCSRHVPQRIPDVSIVDVLSPVNVRYLADIGCATMSALDLHNMTHGDVVILDRVLTDPIEIKAESSGRLLLTAVLRQNEGRLELTAHKFEGSET
jgi:hypothetical protein